MGKGRIVKEYLRHEAKEKALLFAFRLLGLDGGPGSGNFGHEGRPGKVGGSGEGGNGGENGSGSSEESSAKSSAYYAGIEKKRNIAMKWPNERQAEFLFRQGYLTEEEAVEAMENNTSSKRMEDYFDLLRDNGDPTPTKPLRKAPNINDEVAQGKHNPPEDQLWPGDPYTQARMDYIQEWTGMDKKEAMETFGEFQTWFGGSWDRANTDVIDNYIDKDGAYGGEIFRGMHFSEDDYQAFMKDVAPGAKIGMNGHNSSWADNKEMAWHFASGGDRHVLIHCLKNKTAAPVDHLSIHGEEEVIAHSRTLWTVIGVQEGSGRTEITVMESEDRMGEEERDRRKEENDSLPEEQDSSLMARMNGQTRFMRVIPAKRRTAEDGGPGSGNWGHRGRPGKVGGSGKGSGGGTFRSGTKETGYSSFTKNPEFKGIFKLAQKIPNKHMFINYLDAKQVDALESQRKICSPDEDPGDYAKRIYEMLNASKPKEKTRIDGWEDNLNEDDKLFVEQLLSDHDTIAEAIQRDWSDDNRNKLLDLIGKHVGWNERLIDRQFEGLSEKEEEQINHLLDKFPWGDDPKYSHIPNESEILNGGVSVGVLKYYQALKAKAMGVPGIKMPEVPEGLTYSMEHESIKDQISKQNSGYVHTEAGNKNRENIKKTLKDGRLFYGMTEEMKPHQDAIIASVDNMDDRMAQLVNDSLQYAEINWTNGTGTSYYSPDGDITMYMRDNYDVLRTPDSVVRTFWHEYGHFVDSWNSHSKLGFVQNPLQAMYKVNGATEMVITDQMYKEAASKDIQSLIDAAGIGDKYVAKLDNGEKKVSIYRKSDWKRVTPDDPDVSAEAYDIGTYIGGYLHSLVPGRDEYENFFTDHGEPEEPVYEDYYETYVTPKKQQIKTRQKFKGAEEAYMKARDEYYEKRDKWIESIGGNDAYLNLVEERSKLYKNLEENKKKLGNVTDCIDDAVNGLFFLQAVWGAHTMNYYKQHGYPVETTANIFSIRCINDPNVVSFMDKVIPNISKLFTQAWRCGE